MHQMAHSSILGNRSRSPNEQLGVCPDVQNRELRPDFTFCSFKDFFTGIVMGNPNAKPVPEDPKDRPVQVMKPTFDHAAQGIKATWIGHASWLVGARSDLYKISAV